MNLFLRMDRSTSTLLHCTYHNKSLTECFAHQHTVVWGSWGPINVQCNKTEIRCIRSIFFLPRKGIHLEDGTWVQSLANLERNNVGLLPRGPCEEMDSKRYDFQASRQNHCPRYQRYFSVSPRIFEYFFCQMFGVLFSLENHGIPSQTNMLAYFISSSS